MPKMTEAEAERIADRMVWRRLATDSAYQNAENPEVQAEREDEIARGVWADLEAKYDIA